ncbi:LysR family transcriptional regulator [Diaphorobacter aerolatus]|uniref:LysR family transcriptional regulator n=1 Tax=Diaphorobacter aerolatus TaxID=1288495 RepID=A0A7H0GL64_9BURK|nr:LysR family transcriptional regulator [Diaphorobacter aerolatus]QNP49030.1 LysR family transcriptional regulator [Diaphorobacter aerolatus]
MQDLNDMLFFAEVVERGGFTAASHSLGIPKSRLSRRVTELEQQLGVRLLQRTTRKLSLTEVGETYLRHCIAMRDEALAAADAVAQVKGTPRGTVRVSCPVTLAQTVLGELVPTFMERYPEVRVEMRLLNRPVNVVEEGFDVALRVRSSLEESGSMVVKRLGDGRQLLVASVDLLNRQGTPRTLADLERLDSITMPSSDGRYTLEIIGPDGHKHSLQLKPRYVVDDLLMLKFAAVAGTGYCWLPDYLCRQELEDGRLVKLLPDWSQSPGIVHAVFSSRRGLLPAVRAFLDFLGEAVPLGDHFSY